MVRVLAVEDDTDLMFVYETILEQNGYEVVRAETVSTAMSELSEKKFDVIILDLNLPDAHGSVIVDHLRENGSSVDHIIVVTANNHWVDDIIDRGVQHIMAKPVSMSEVIQRIKEITT